MKITNENIGWWSFGLLHIKTFILFFFTYFGKDSLSLVLFVVLCSIIGIMWLFILITLLIDCANGNLKFEININPFSNYFDKLKHNRKIKKAIHEQKLKAIADIDYDDKFEYHSNKIIELEKLLK